MILVTITPGYRGTELRYLAFTAHPQAILTGTTPCRHGITYGCFNIARTPLHATVSANHVSGDETKTTEQPMCLGYGPRGATQMGIS